MDDLDNLAVDLSRERFDRGNRSMADTFGAENTAPGRALADNCLPRLEAAIAADLRPEQAPETALEAAFVRAGHSDAVRASLSHIESSRLATAILSGAIRVLGHLSDIDVERDDDDDNRDVTLGATIEAI